MTDYNNFIQDFPARCQDVLELAYGPAEARDREVTLLIMTAAAAFLVPFERLRPGTFKEHPAQDRRQYPELAQRLDSAMAQPFLESPFHEGGPASWSAGKIVNLEASTKYEPLTKKITAAQVLSIIRNSLAHGNLTTRGSPIEGLRFSSEDRKDGNHMRFKYVYVSPTDFHDFLNRWLAFLKRHNVPPLVVSEALARAA